MFGRVEPSLSPEFGAELPSFIVGLSLDTANTGQTEVVTTVKYEHHHIHHYYLPDTTATAPVPVGKYIFCPGNYPSSSM